MKLGIKAPKEVELLRKELYVSVENMNMNAGQSVITANELKNQFKNLKKIDLAINSWLNMPITILEQDELHSLIG